MLIIIVVSQYNISHGIITWYEGFCSGEWDVHYRVCLVHIMPHMTPELQLFAACAGICDIYQASLDGFQVFTRLYPKYYVLDQIICEANLVIWWCAVLNRVNGLCIIDGNNASNSMKSLSVLRYVHLLSLQVYCRPISTTSSPKWYNLRGIARFLFLQLPGCKVPVLCEGHTISCSKMLYWFNNGSHVITAVK